jgi:hypothetical protein
MWFLFDTRQWSQAKAGKKNRINKTRVCGDFFGLYTILGDLGILGNFTGIYRI